MADLEWATDEHYADGVTDTKVEPGAGVKAKGCIPDEANVSAQEMNWHLHELSTRQAQQAPDVQVFEYPGGTWTKPTGAAWVELLLVGAGGGGGEGTGTPGPGGAGGGSGAITIRRVRAAELPATLTVAPGVYGLGALSGGDGTTGAATTVTGTGVSLSATGGGGGQGGGGTNVGGIAGAADPRGGWSGSAGGNAGAAGAPGSNGGTGWLGDVGGVGGAAENYGLKGLGYGAGGGGSSTASLGGGGGGASGYGTASIAENGTATHGGNGGYGLVIITTWCDASL